MAQQVEKDKIIQSNLFARGERGKVSTQDINKRRMSSQRFGFDFVAQDMIQNMNQHSPISIRPILNVI